MSLDVRVASVMLTGVSAEHWGCSTIELEGIVGTGAFELLAELAPGPCLTTAN